MLLDPDLWLRQHDMLDSKFEKAGIGRNKNVFQNDDFRTGLIDMLSGEGFFLHSKSQA